MAGLAVVGLLLLQPAPSLGVLLLLVSGGYLAWKLSIPARERRRQLETERRQTTEAEQWRHDLEGA